MPGEIEHIRGKGFDKRPQNINRKGRPPVLPELKEMIAKIMAEEKNGMTGLEAVLKSLLVRAVKGDSRAAAELLDRYYGKAQQNVNITNQLPTIIIQNVSKLYPNGLPKDDGVAPDQPAE